RTPRHAGAAPPRRARSSLHRRSCMLHLLRFDDLAALLRALVSAADVHEPLPLALVHALARVVRSGARPLAFAGVDTGTVHFSASLLVCVPANVAGEDERSSRARDQH